MLVAACRRVVAIEIGQRDEVPQVAVAQEAQALCHVHDAVERGVPGRRPFGPAQAIVEPAGVAEGGRDVRVDAQVVGVVLERAPERGDGVVGAAGRPVGAGQPHLSQFRGGQPDASGGVPDRGAVFAEPARDGRRGAVQLCVARVGLGRVEREPQVRPERATALLRGRIAHRAADGQKGVDESLRVDPSGQGPVRHPRNPRPVLARIVPGGRGQQLDGVRGPAGRREQVRPGDDGADVRVLLQREQLQAAVGPRGELAQGLVHLGQRRRVRDRSGQMPRRVRQVALVECDAHHGQLALGRQPRIPELGVHSRCLRPQRDGQPRPRSRCGGGAAEAFLSMAIPRGRCGPRRAVLRVPLRL
jgi:hypothetical protein